MRSSIKIIFILLFTIFIAGCNNGDRHYLEDGAYYVTTTSTKNFVFNYKNASIDIIDQDSISFPLINEMYKGTNGNNFKYELYDKKIVLMQNDFKKSLSVQLSQDGTAKIDFDLSRINYIIFKHADLNLDGQFKMGGFTFSKDANKEDIMSKYQDLFTSYTITFKNDNKASLSPTFAHYFTGDSINTSYNYNISGKEIEFNNEDSTFKFEYSYDGILHFHLNDKNFEKWDLSNPSQSVTSN